ncbi:manganese-binding protein [Mariprofundus sp. EBB-1]|uniref:metal ABC transporter solute-binding protein, Zn/Mn family n=1 Tax=Mariprofundus sp. EBB-1 TaxID=2650971 RepID=UPI000EF26104|nr:zinc ABC transporter substrate-binding protein [Mariprofundus sp. EBB-1]RLL55013.1 manganese-binding protein [Mariprofundus sp. EBB-1]
MRIVHHSFYTFCRALGFAFLLNSSVSCAAKAAEIAVTLPPLAGLIAMLDNKADVLCLLANGSDPHHFQLTPRKIEAAEQTALLMRASKDDGGWPLPPKHARTLDLWPEIDHGWLSPVAVRNALPAIAKTLSDLHPERQADIAVALEHALKTTQTIEVEWKDALKEASTSGVLMQHPSWRRLMQLMEVPVLNVLESGHHGHEHGPRQLEHALQSLNTHPGAWLIADDGHSNRSLDWLQNHTSVTLHRVRLNAVGTCSQSWPELMRQNIAQFRTKSLLSPTSESGQRPDQQNDLQTDHHHDHPSEAHIEHQSNSQHGHDSL